MDKRDRQHLQWVRDRLVNVYGESNNVDFVIRLDGIITKIIEGECESADSKPEPQKQFKYEKVTFDRASSALMSWEEFHAGNEAYHLYIKTGDRFVEPDIYQVVGNYENLYRKTELDAVEELAKELHEIDWQEIKANGEWDDLSDEAVLSYKKMAKHAIDKLGAK